MKKLELKPGHKAIKAYYQEIENLGRLRLSGEGTVSPAFAALLKHCAGQVGWTLAEQVTVPRGDRAIRVDGLLLDEFNLRKGVWEAKDSHDDLAREVRRKFEQGYPRDNILFQAPDRIIVWQDGRQVFDEDVSRPADLIHALERFFGYEPPAYEQWQQAVEEFKAVVPELAAQMQAKIEAERRSNSRFIEAFDAFSTLCKASINPNLSARAVEEMLIQHILTERIFRRVFDNPDFVERNAIAHEIEKVVAAMTSAYFSRHEFLRSLDRFYVAIETTAATIDDYAEKQNFLNTVYEKFFQGFSARTADTHGIVYTPQPIVEFMVRSVEALLQAEFGRSLSDPGVHILDPFVGTGTFIVRVMREVRKSCLPEKYATELHCNEVMLLPYYVAAMNIEHAYYELAGTYAPFDGLCLVDTFQLAEHYDGDLFSMTKENTARVSRQKAAPIFVILGNPPYNARQVNENDNNKNRKYPEVDRRVAETYARDSAATNKNPLSDVFVKAYRWASDRLAKDGEGILAFVSNDSFLDNLAFDGMRKDLAREFDAIYVLDLGGNVRRNPKLSGSTHNVFGIQVGVSINLLVRRRRDGPAPRAARVYYARTDEFWRKEQKCDFLDEKQDYRGVDWQEMTPDARGAWLTAELHTDFDAFLPLAVREANVGPGAGGIFAAFSNGVKTNRDTWVYNFNRGALARNIRNTIETYNEHVYKWERMFPKPENIDDFVLNDSREISWSRDLKQDLKRGRIATYDEAKIRRSLYRPFTISHLFFDRILNEEVYQLPRAFPTATADNCLICVNQTAERPFASLMTDRIASLEMCGGFGSHTFCFPFYTYDEDGGNRRESITDWALAQFRAHYGDPAITRWDLFHYIYAVLHHPDYRTKYAANLRRDLPRVPFAPEFRALAVAGARLAELHVGYEAQPEYPLRWVESPSTPLSWRVDRMRLSPDRTELTYNDFLTLGDIPPAVFGYRLGNRSALEWVIDQYRVTTDTRSGLVNDPNRLDDPQYIVRLIGRVVAVSVETVRIVGALPPVVS